MKIYQAATHAPEQMDRRRDPLSHDRAQESSRGGIEHAGLAQHRREVEGGEDRQAVAQAEAAYRLQSHRARRALAEHSREGTIFADVEAEIGDRGSYKLGLVVLLGRRFHGVGNRRHCVESDVLMVEGSARGGRGES